MQVDFVQALRDIGREKEIPLETLSEIIEAALVSAYKKHYGAICEIHVDIEWDEGSATVFSRKRVVEHVENPHIEMSLADARRLDPTVEEGEYLDIEVAPSEFGRIAAQTAKQVVAQRIREAEREIIYEEFSNRDGDVVTGVVQRREGRTVLVDIGRLEAVLPASEQSALDSYRTGERVKVYILEVKRTTRTPRVLISRSHPGLLRRLFELEVPEVHEGIVELKAQAREPGARSKVAVVSKQENVDPVGACVGHRGSRVQAVVDELRGEKVDIVRWSDESSKYVASALSPAKVSRVIIDEQTHSATVIAPENQLSLAIGREGQNVRLAARLTGWRIDIRSEAQIAEQEAAARAAEAPAPAEAEIALDQQPTEPPAEETTEPPTEETAEPPTEEPAPAVSAEAAAVAEAEEPATAPAAPTDEEAHGEAVAQEPVPSPAEAEPTDPTGGYQTAPTEVEPAEPAPAPAEELAPAPAPEAVRADEEPAPAQEEK
jgi:N utilization substance protein A